MHTLPLVCFTFALLIVSTLSAQDSTRPTPAVARKPGKALETQITVELLTGVEGASFRAQKWTRLMQELDIPLQIRRGFGDENKTGVSEKIIGTSLREVRIVGRIDPDATIHVDQRKFRDSDAAKFREWIKELQTYGTQGAPQGKPIWGLSLKQFEELYAALAPPIDESPLGKPVRDALRELPLPKQFPLLLDESARTALEARPDNTVQTDLKGFSVGLALAIILKEQNLGFYPRRTPEGTVELGVADRQVRDDVWPVGWPPQGDGFEQLPRLIPEFVALADLHTVDEPLEKFMERVQQQINNLPILYDRAALERDHIDLATLTVNLPSKRMTWLTGLKAALFKHRMRPEILTDEGGRIFLWITSDKIKPLLPIPTSDPADSSKTEPTPKPN